jgi:hypothetical protein
MPSDRWTPKTRTSSQAAWASRSCTRKVIAAALIALLTGCRQPKYGEEKQLTLNDGTHPIWAVAPAINLSGESSVDVILQADLVYHQLGAVNNVTLIPVIRVVQVYSALHITKVESEEQAALVCEQLGCDGLIIPTITIYDPYNPPKLGASLQLLRRTPGNAQVNNVDARELTRMAAPMETQALPNNPQFLQVVGMYDAANGSVHAAVLRYASGRYSPEGPLGANEYFVSMDRYCEFVYYTLIEQLLTRVSGKPQPAVKTEQTAQIGFTAQPG